MNSSKVKPPHLDIETLRRITGHHPAPRHYFEQYLKWTPLKAAENLSSKGEKSNERE